MRSDQRSSIGNSRWTYVLEAVDLLAREGWKLLPLYRFDPETGLWRHRDARPEPPLALQDALAGSPAAVAAPESALAGQLAAARRIIRELEAAPPACPADPWVSEAFDRIRWFPLPGEAVAQLRGA